MTEDKEEQAGHRIGVVTSLLTEMKASGEAIDLDTIEQCVLRFPTIDLQQRALEQADNLLRGTAWSQRSGIVEKKMYAQQKEQQDRQEKMDEAVKKSLEEPRTQNIYGDKNEFKEGAKMLKLTLPADADPAEIAMRIAEQQKQIEKMNGNEMNS